MTISLTSKDCYHAGQAELIEFRDPLFTFHRDRMTVVSTYLSLFQFLEKTSVFGQFIPLILVHSGSFTFGFLFYSELFLLLLSALFCFFLRPRFLLPYWS